MHALHAYYDEVYTQCVTVRMCMYNYVCISAHLQATKYVST